MSFKSLATRRSVLGAVAALTMVGAGVALAPVASAAAAAGTLSSPSGPDAGGNGLTMTTASAVFASGLAVQFQPAATAATACATGYAAAAGNVQAVSSPKVLSSTKIAFTVPAGVTVASPGPNWLVCVYSGTSTSPASPVVASAKYTVAAKPTISAVTPSSGPALGGNTVTITGTNFPTGTLTASTTPVVKIGSLAATGVKVVNATTITATAPAQAASASGLAVSVTTTGGVTTPVAPVTYTYKNGIQVTPSFVVAGASAASVDLDIMGVGFSSLNFTATNGATPTSADAHVLVSAGPWTGTAQSECVNVLVISDNELICTVDPQKQINTGTYDNSTPLAQGTYTVVVVDDASSGTPTYESLVSSGSTLTVADF